MYIYIYYTYAKCISCGVWSPFGPGGHLQIVKRCNSSFVPGRTWTTRMMEGRCPGNLQNPNGSTVRSTCEFINNSSIHHTWILRFILSRFFANSDLATRCQYLPVFFTLIPISSASIATVVRCQPVRTSDSAEGDRFDGGLSGNACRVCSILPTAFLKQPTVAASNLEAECGTRTLWNCLEWRA